MDLFTYFLKAEFSYFFFLSYELCMISKDDLLTYEFLLKCIKTSQIEMIQNSARLV